MTRVLIVDDVLADQRLAGGLLSKHPGFEIHYAANGRDGLSQFEAHQPDIVLTDLQMPEMNGLQLVAALRERSPATPVILMTAQGSEEIAMEAIQQGAASYVPKRLLARDLVETVGRVLAASTERGTEQQLLHRLSEIAYVVQNEKSVISALVALVRRLFRERGFLNESESLRVSTAIDEALQNAYYHGNLEVDSKLRERPDNAFHDLADERRQRPPYRDRKIRFHLRIDENEASVTIGDEGPGFDVTNVPNPTAPEFFERSHGRGVFLMRAFMDEVSFNDRGNEVSLVKRRRTRSPEGTQRTFDAAATESASE
jgi:CheY-like chemotaxis protein/anti-sigma regulatory factor (Ser/Thr protein kinase)